MATKLPADEDGLSLAIAAVKVHARALETLGLIWRLTSTSTEGDVVGVYDTLLCKQQGFARADADEIALVIRNALCAWHDVSKRPGMSFTQNVSFWMDALQMRPDIRVYAGSPRVTRAFPRVVFFFLEMTTALVPFIPLSPPPSVTRELASDGIEAVDDNRRPLSNLRPTAQATLQPPPSFF